MKRIFTLFVLVSFCLAGRAGLPPTTLNNITQFKFLDQNYIAPYGNAEKGTTNWSTYADSAGSVPVDCTAGSPGVTIGTTTSSPLQGVKSYQFIHDAANRQGNGWSTPVTIDRGDRNKSVTVSFQEELASGTFVTGAASDARIYLYDVTNSQLLYPKGVDSDKINSLPGTFSADFDLTSSTSYRICVHTATTTATAWTLNADSVSFNVANGIRGPPIGNWNSFTPTGAWTGNITYTGQWRRVGDSMEVNILLALTGAPTGATLSVNLPSGYTIDTSKLGTGTASNAALPGGVGSLLDSGTRAFDLTVAYNSTTSVNPLTLCDSNSACTNTIQPTQPFTFANGDQVVLNFTVPIVGWSSNVTLENTRTFRASSVIANGTRVTATPTTLGQYRTRTRTQSALTYNDNAPGTGPSSVNGMLQYNRAFGAAAVTTNTEAWDIFVGKNKVVQFVFYNTTGFTGFADASPSYDTAISSPTGVQTSYDPATGVASTAAYVDSGGTGTVRTHHTGSGATNVPVYFDVIVGDTPVTMTSAPVVSAKYQTSVATAFGSSLVVPFATKSWDTNNTFASNVFTCPRTGYVDVKAFLSFASMAYTVNEFISLSIRKNTVSQSDRIQRAQATTTHNWDSFIEDTVPCNAGDTIDIFLTPGTAGNPTLDAQAARNYVIFNMLGN